MATTEDKIEKLEAQLVKARQDEDQDAVAKLEAKLAELKTDDAEVESMAVYDKRGVFVRTYTAAVHGDRVKEYAEEYAAKIGGTVKKA